MKLFRGRKASARALSRSNRVAKNRKFVRALEELEARWVMTLSAPWVAADVGSVGIAGSSNNSGTTFTVTGAGDDIWNYDDAFQFCYQTVTGDQAIVAKVTGITEADFWSKAGVMVRNSLASNSANYYTCISPATNGTLQMQLRDPTGLDTGTINGVGGKSVPVWLQIQRTGTSINSFWSQDGNDWRPLFEDFGYGSGTFGSSILLGLAVTSHNTGATNTSTFTNVRIGAVPGTPGAPTATKISNTQINLSWTAATNATGYNIYRTTSADDEVLGSPINASPVTGTTFSDTGVNLAPAGSAYYYKIRAVNGTTTNGELIGRMSGESNIIYTPLAFTEAGTWTAFTTTPAWPEIVQPLSNGTFIIKDAGSTTWRKLTPSSTGSYTAGTWTTLPSSSGQHIYTGTALMQNGKMMVAGGEYGGSNSYAEVYDPLSNTWSESPLSGNAYNDADVKLLSNGKLLWGGSGTAVNGTGQLYDPATNSWSQTGTMANGYGNAGELTFALLPDGSILMPTVENGDQSVQSQRYFPNTNTWAADANLPASLFSRVNEIGGSANLPNGKVVFFGGSGRTMIYTPSGNSSPGTWAQGATMPYGLGCADTNCCVMKDGKVMVVLNPKSALGFGYKFVVSYDYVNDRYENINVPANFVLPDYLMQLPDGGTLSTGNTKIYEFMPTNGPGSSTWQPQVSGVVTNSDGTLQVSGTMLNGWNQGGSFGDDAEMATNFPTVRFVSSGGTVYYGTSLNWNYTGISVPGGTTNPESVSVKLPSGMPAGTYNMFVVANGIASAAKSISITTIAAPTGLAASAGKTSITLTWGSVAGATSYSVYRGIAAGGEDALPIANVNTTSYIDNSPKLGVKYYYKVTANKSNTGTTDMGARSGLSTEVSATAKLGNSTMAGTDVGAVGVTGSSTFSNGTYTLTGSGSDVWGTADAFQFDYVPVSGNFSVRVNVASLTNSGGDANGKAGLMIRNGLTAANQEINFNYLAGNGREFGSRPTEGGFLDQTNINTGAFTAGWLRIDRTNAGTASETYTAYTSTDGNTWTQFDVPKTLQMTGSSVNVGMYVCSHNNGVLNTSTFNKFSIMGVGSGTTYWATSDMSAPVGGTAFKSGGSTLYLSGSGVGVKGTADTLRYASYNVSGDVTFTARLNNVAGLTTVGQVGIMLRKDTTQGSPTYALEQGSQGGVATSISNFFALKRTAQAGSVSASRQFGDSGFSNYWIRIQRTGSGGSGETYTAFLAGDNAGSPGTWYQIDQQNFQFGASNIVAALYVASGSSANLATAWFDNISITPGGIGFFAIVSSGASSESPGTIQFKGGSGSSAGTTVSFGDPTAPTGSDPGDCDHPEHDHWHDHIQEVIDQISQNVHRRHLRRLAALSQALDSLDCDWEGQGCRS